MVGLAAMIALLLYPAPTTWTAMISTPLILLLVAGAHPPRKWGGWVAAALIPYFAGALGEAIAAPEDSAKYWVLTLLTVISFLSAFYLVRRSRVDLRR